MAKRHWLAKLLLYAALEMGALFGVPIRPEDIEELTRKLNGTVTASEQVEDQDAEDDP